MRKAIAGMSSLVILTAIGARFECVFVPYMVFGAVCSITVLVALDKIKTSEYPIYIFGMSLALIWQTSMMGAYVVGTDIHGEIFAANRAIAQGWDWGYADPSNTSIVIGWLTPLLDRFGLSPVWQFKLLYPVMLASVPLILYFAYRKMIEEKRAYFAALFFMIMPMFFMETVGIVKSMVAEMFLALMVLFIVLDLKNWQKALGIGLSAVLASLCHYTIGTFAIAYLFGSLVVLAIIQPTHLTWFQNRHMPFLHRGVVVVCVLAVFIIWFSSIGQGIMIGYYTRFYSSLSSIASTYFAPSPTSSVPKPPASTVPSTPIPPVTPSIPSPKDSPPSDSAKTDKPPEVVNPPTVNELSKPSYLFKQEPLVQTALGLDFGKASPLGKAFRVIQYLTQFLLVSGFAYLLIRHRRYKFTMEFVSCVLVSYGWIGLCVFFPLFSTLINASRFYQVSLFFLAPMFVVGTEELWDDLGKGVLWITRYR